ncbi:hypothetical protein [Methylobacterium marchantiae]|uniref:Uncharacterized protein n=1 Tax=Methylobacterium marchantiae TaxID=600331 RepID=A0ABW3WZ76_9HYPH
MSEAGSGMALPLLPTLAVAVIVSAASFLCQAPSAPAPATFVETRMVEMESRPVQAEATETVAAFVPAALAFRDQFPLRDHFVVSAEAAPRKATTRVAAKPNLRRRDAARSDMAKADSVKTDATRPPSVVAAKALPSSPEPLRAQAEAEENLLPDLALPFAPAISAISRAGSFVSVQSAVAGAKVVSFGGARVVALGNVVTGLVDRLPLQP